MATSEGASSLQTESLLFKQTSQQKNHTLAMMLECTCISRSEKEGVLRCTSSVIISITRLASVVPRTTTLGYTSLPSPAPHLQVASEAVL